MSDKSAIEWTEATWNPVTGCCKVSQGCKNCYALREWPRMAGNPATVYYGREFTDVRCHPERLDQPLRWTRPRRIFVNSMSDLFHPDVPFEFIDQVFAVMALAPQHTFQVLTKRPERMREYLSSPDIGLRIGEAESEFAKLAQFYKPKNGTANVHIACRRHLPLLNVWLGVSVEDQATADQRIPLLLEIPAAVRWISAEPLLGPINLGLLGTIPITISPNYTMMYQGLHWVVVGGESGRNGNARVMLPSWARSLRDQCNTAGVPFLFKQWGEFAPDENGLWGTAEDRMTLVGKKSAGRLLDGRTWDEYPRG